MTLTLLWVNPNCLQIAEMGSRYQYRHIKTLRSTRGRPITKLSIVFFNSAASTSCSTSLLAGIQSDNSSKAKIISPPPRFSALRDLHLSMEIRRVIFPKKDDSTDGRWGGMLFQAARYVSFTLSSASSVLASMLWAMV